MSQQLTQLVFTALQLYVVPPFQKEGACTLSIYHACNLKARGWITSLKEIFERKKEVVHVMDVMEHGHSKAFLRKCMKRRMLDADVKEKLKESVSVLYVRGLNEQIRRIIGCSEIGVAFKPGSWKTKMMAGVTDQVEIGKRSGVMYKIEWEMCDKCILVKPGGVMRSELSNTTANRKTGTGTFSSSGACLGRSLYPLGGNDLGNCTKDKAEKNQEGTLHSWEGQKGKNPSEQEQRVEIQ